MAPKRLRIAPPTLDWSARDRDDAEPNERRRLLGTAPTPPAEGSSSASRPAHVDGAERRLNGSTRRLPEPLRPTMPDTQRPQPAIAARRRQAEAAHPRPHQPAIAPPRPRQLASRRQARIQSRNPYVVATLTIVILLLSATLIGVNRFHSANFESAGLSGRLAAITLDQHSEPPAGFHGLPGLSSHTVLWTELGTRKEVTVASLDNLDSSLVAYHASGAKCAVQQGDCVAATDLVHRALRDIERIQLPVAILAANASSVDAVLAHELQAVKSAWAKANQTYDSIGNLWIWTRPTADEKKRAESIRHNAPAYITELKGKRIQAASVRKEAEWLDGATRQLKKDLHNLGNIGGGNGQILVLHNCTASSFDQMSKFFRQGLLRTLGVGLETRKSYEAWWGSLSCSKSAEPAAHGL